MLVPGANGVEIIKKWFWHKNQRLELKDNFISYKSATTINRFIFLIYFFLLKYFIPLQAKI